MKKQRLIKAIITPIICSLALLFSSSLFTADALFAEQKTIYTGDTIKTGADGSVGVTFRDNTILSLGPNSVVVIQEFLFAPAQGKLSLVTRLIKGTAAYLFGVIAKLSPQSVRFETPVATVGFRGTKVLVKIDEEASN